MWSWISLSIAEIQIMRIKKKLKNLVFLDLYWDCSFFWSLIFPWDRWVQAFNVTCRHLGFKCTEGAGPRVLVGRSDSGLQHEVRENGIKKMVEERERGKMSPHPTTSLFYLPTLRRLHYLNAWNRLAWHWCASFLYLPLLFLRLPHRFIAWLDLGHLKPRSPVRVGVLEDLTYGKIEDCALSSIFLEGSLAKLWSKTVQVHFRHTCLTWLICKVILWAVLSLKVSRWYPALLFIHVNKPPT